MMTIGEMARLGGVSVRMLRHYDRIGLLRPAAVGTGGRRQYAPDQLERLHRVVSLKEQGFRLEEVSRFLDGDGTDVVGLLRRREEELRATLHDTHHRLDRVRARLRLAEAAGTGPRPVGVREVEPLRLAAVHRPAADVAALGTLLPALFDRAAEAVDAVGGSRSRPVAVYDHLGDRRPRREGTVDLTVGYAVPGRAVPGLAEVDLPAARVASAIHHGPMAGIGVAYSTLVRWAGENGAPTGRWRELYLDADGADQSDWTVEVQLELPG